MPRDLQKLRTKRDIQTAFIKLVNEKGFKNVTVGDIAKESLINRQTFYYHYQDKYQLTEAMIKELVQKYDDLYKHYVAANLKKLDLTSRIPLLFPQTNTFWAENRETAAALFSIEYSDYTLENELKKRFRQYLPTLLGHEPLPLEKNVFPAIILSVIEYVIETGNPPSQEDIIHTFDSISDVFK
ncbi:TetR/AcrR family transcriptional regulator [Lentilactobacillus hilgardii]|uniref:Transcriptional regulator, TetR family n=1 Tax=Lentilactobacillus hilgardii (strain ATCC 8290 / DSM 20176 / CCUG 30140 / JCM 1155 / KCTC 3500 / NBRC 15886 / NCIMB 8040 / NRRL B-1843 / 9) TaxID=1423757 RepID=C0XK84_LENH9|nr:TetR/AcrR family transcriptional regulator [Lentilactobacillus hilgardii]EEI24268.1 transcriptional regulator, TetR family [Lentilactobacillus hilgardii DSM 20176 = ATCC 8290]KRK56749.1 transcription regulator [Lentilactobacillus hilgardii DSM 20176 = ATCC 8290]QEU37951.1 TetR/AcrR family transcriptional regulator [Lentilactobacillus hilgardii]TDG86308.1 hypothetical protein C5L34_001792 [Lentilactobacillus hilgardii]